MCYKISVKIQTLEILNHSDVHLFRKSMYEAGRKVFLIVPKTLIEVKIMLYKNKNDFFFKDERFLFMLILLIMFFS